MGRGRTSYNIHLTFLLGRGGGSGSGSGSGAVQYTKEARLSIAMEGPAQNTKFLTNVQPLACRLAAEKQSEDSQQPLHRNRG